MMYTLDIGNSIGLWIAVIPLLAVVLAQAILIYRKAVATAPMVGLTKEDRSTAFHVGIISAIGPSFSAMISTITMSSIMGAPVTYQRVSIIASASTELRACQYTAEASGYELAATGMPMEIFSACLWVMAINGCGWLVFVLLFNDKMTTISNKITGGSAAIMSAFATAAILGTTTYMGSGYLLGTSYQRAALFSALIFSVIMDRLIVPKAPKLKAWNMGLSLLVGMICAQICYVNTLFG